MISFNDSGRDFLIKKFCKMNRLAIKSKCIHRNFQYRFTGFFHPISVVSSFFEYSTRTITFVFFIQLFYAVNIEIASCDSTFFLLFFPCSIKKRK